MHATWCVWIILCAQAWPVCSPDSKNTLNSQIRTNLAGIWYGYMGRQIKCASILGCVLKSNYVLRQHWNVVNLIPYIPWSLISNPIGQDMAPCTPENSVNACWRNFLMAGMSPCFCWYLYIPHPTQIDKILKSTLTLEFCAQPLRPVWLMYVHIAELEKDVEFRAIKNLSGFNGFKPDYSC